MKALSSRRNAAILLVTLLAWGAQPVWAASSGTLTVSGTVAVVNNITITPNGSNNTSLSITGGEAGKNIASVAEQSNSLNGYHIEMYSTNGGELQNTSDASKKTTYQISYDGGTYTTPPTVSSPVTVKNVTSLSALTTNNSTVLINVVANSTAPAGTYSDTITLSIVAN